MPQSSRAFQLASLLTLLSVAVFVPTRAQAQSGYLFEPPTVTLSVRGGAGGPLANDDLFKFFTSELTLNRSDFRGSEWSTDLFVRAAPRVDIGIGYSYDRSNNRSEFRKWDYGPPNYEPIEQTTRLRRSSINLSARIYPAARGRAVGNHAWVPAALNPYVLVGGGIMFYELSQRGEFVRASDQNIITGDLFSADHGASWHVGGGAQFWATSHFGLTAEGRYEWAKATLDRDFADYNKIDLSGFQVTTGLAVRF